ncbi:nucleotidyltransferase family protein [Paenibacillus glycanilyticus]|uniref:nucleotidyltransferase family protein n=1 Tax=Paenibacillus glycanilyticus TaxID=126569 RepID=UPI003EBBFEB0
MRQLENEQDIIDLVLEDEWMMKVLHTAGSLNLPDWWVCAGFVRSKVWDYLHGYTEQFALPDVDLIYYDPSQTDEAEEKALEQKLRDVMPDVPWSVKNEARMHLVNDIEPYSSAVDAMSKFPETVTALGLTLDGQNGVVLSAPHGIRDLLGFVVRPTPHFKQSPALMAIYEKRLLQKNWKSRWNKAEAALTQVYMVRHAHSVYKADEELYRPLSPQGEEAARKVADLLADEQISAIISSPYKRALQTVEPLALRRGLTIQVEEDFRERLLADRPQDDFHYAIRKVWEEEAFSWPGGESNLVAQHRGVQALQSVLRRYQGDTIAIGTHGNLMALMIKAFKPEYGFAFWQQLSMPDIHKLSFNGLAFTHIERVWDVT